MTQRTIRLRAPRSPDARSLSPTAPVSWPNSAWQNPYVESFASRVRDELLAVELFSCLAEAQVLVEDCGEQQNPGENIPTASQANSQSSYRGTTTHPPSSQSRWLVPGSGHGGFPAIGSLGSES